MVSLMRLWILASLLLLAFATPSSAQSSLEDFCKALESDSTIEVTDDSLGDELQARFFVIGGMNLLQTSPEFAIDLFNQAIDLDDEYADPYLGRGCAYALQGDEESAFADLEQFLQLSDDSDLADTLADLLGSTSTTTTTTEAEGDCVLVTRDPVPFADQADAQEFIENFSESVKSPDYLGRSDAYLCLGDYDSALVDLTTYIAQEPDDPEGYTARGIIYRRLGEYETAIDDFDDALEIDADYVSAVNGRAYSYYLSGDFEQCIEDYDRSIELDDQDPIAFGNRGLCYGALEDDESAIEDYNLALELDPNNAIIIGNRAVSYRILGEYELALADNNRAIELDPTDPFYYVERGLVYYAQERYRSALEDFTFAAELDPNDAAAWLNIGDAQRILKDDDAAVEAYQRYLELYPDSPYVQELEEYIDANQ
jgi:tetratricopeptide (TPR) repeat protein